MGRKSLLKSTKKKASEKKAKESATGAIKSEATVQKKAAVVKAAPAAAISAVKAAPAKMEPKKTQTTIATAKKAVEKKDITGKSKKSEPAQKKIPTVRELLFKQFETGADKVRPVQLKKSSVKIPDAPAFVSGYGKKDTDRIRGLLFQQFDLRAVAPVSPKSAPKTQKKEVSMKDLLFKKFEGHPVKAVKIEKASMKIPDAPAYVSGYGKEDAQKIRALLFQKFDLTVVKPKVKEAVAVKAAQAPVSGKDLLFKQFEWAAIKPMKTARSSAALSDAPPFFSGLSKEEAARIHAVLFRKFDLSAAKSEVKEAAGGKTTPVPESGRGILFKQFEWAAVRPAKTARPSATVPDAPPFFSGLSKEEAAKIHAVLFKQFQTAPERKPTVAAAKAVTPSCEPSPAPESCACMGKGKKLAVWVLAAVVALLIGVSYSNRSHYYLKDVNGVVQVWQGKFAPSGEEAILTLDGATMPENVQPVYTKQEISPIVFDFMMGKADSLLDAFRGPDFGAMKQCLLQARDFAPTPMLRTRVQNRLRSIDFVVLFHKADVAIGKGEPRDLMAAKAYLGKARDMASTAYQKEMVAKAQAAVEEAIAGGQQ